MKFEWDPDKAAKNLRKHGVSFPQAVEAFYDPDRIEEYNGNVDGEERWHVIGRVGSTLLILFVVYTQRSYGNQEEIVRIVSARKASRLERSRCSRLS